jgi:hypothetical protein
MPTRDRMAVVATCKMLQVQAGSLMTFGVARNTLFLLSVQVLDKATSYLFLVYVTRSFGSEFFGTYVTAVTLVLMAGNLMDFGLYNLVVRDLAQDRSRVRAKAERILPLRPSLAMAAASPRPPRRRCGSQTFSFQRGVCYHAFEGECVDVTHSGLNLRDSDTCRNGTQRASNRFHRS